MENQSNTIVALATAIGAGSIAVVRISGEDSIRIVNRVFSGKDLEEVAGNTIHFGRIKDTGLEIDQVLVSVFRSPNSYTGENLVEISCHSNHFIVEDVITSLIDNGARMANPGEFTLRAFLNQKLDLSQAEAISNIVSSKSKLATRNSILHLEGDLSRKIKKIKDELIGLVSFMELDLDFSEEDIEVIPKSDIEAKIDSTNQKIDQLIQSYNKAKYLSGSLEIAIIGKPNAGKSMLLNALLGEDRAIVTDIAGTTRDTIEENLSLKNMLLKISDTAGIRFSKNQVESAGIERTWKRVERSDLVLWVFDISENMNKLDHRILNMLRKYDVADIIIVKNKIDLKYSNRKVTMTLPTELPVVEISAKTGEGIDELKDKIYSSLSEKYQHAGEEIIITNTRQVKILDRVKQYLVQSKNALVAGEGNEFVVVELRNALDTLGLITGETATEDILNNIFSGFCIGK